jgi:hypothetical protein
MRILGLVLVTSFAVGYLAHTTRAAECDATAVRSAPRATANLPIYYGGMLAPIVVEAEREPARSLKSTTQPAATAAGTRSAVLN